MLVFLHPFLNTDEKISIFNIQNDKNPFPFMTNTYELSIYISAICCVVASKRWGLELENEKLHVTLDFRDGECSNPEFRLQNHI